MRGVICALLLFFAAAVPAAPRLSVNTGFITPVSDIYRLVIEDAFARAELSVDFREVPGDRAITLVDQGIDDGECCRIWEINEKYANLVRIPVPVLDIDFVAFTKDPELRLNGAQDWQGLTPYHVGVVGGWKILEYNLDKNRPRLLYTLSTPASMFSMLDRDRIQVATIDRLVGYQNILDMNLPGVRAVEPPLVSRPLYLFLHRKHAALVPRLTAILEDMRKEGTLERYYWQVVDPLEARLNQLR